MMVQTSANDAQPRVHPPRAFGHGLAPVVRGSSYAQADDQHLGAVMAMIVTTGVVLAAHQFPDVPDDHTFHSDIDWLVDNGITTGYPNGNFGPEDTVTRGQMAAFLHRYNTGAPDLARR